MSLAVKGFRDRKHKKSEQREPQTSQYLSMRHESNGGNGNHTLEDVSVDDQKNYVDVDA